MKIEIFSAGCQLCEDAIVLVNDLACPSCDISVLDMHQEEVSAKAKHYGIQRVPAVVVGVAQSQCISV